MKTLLKFAYFTAGFILTIILVAFYLWFGSWLIAGVFGITFTVWQFIQLHLLAGLIHSVLKWILIK